MLSSFCKINSIRFTLIWVLYFDDMTFKVQFELCSFLANTLVGFGGSIYTFLVNFCLVYVQQSKNFIFMESLEHQKV